MAETITDLSVTSVAWTDISGESGISSGTKYDIQNKKGAVVMLQGT